MYWNTFGSLPRISPSTTATATELIYPAAKRNILVLIFSNSLPFCIISIRASSAIFGEGKSAASKLPLPYQNKNGYGYDYIF